MFQIFGTLHIIDLLFNNTEYKKAQWGKKGADECERNTSHHRPVTESKSQMF